MTWLYVLGGAWLYAVAGGFTYKLLVDPRDDWASPGCVFGGIFWPLALPTWLGAQIPGWWDRRIERRRVEAERMARLLAEVESELRK